MRTKRKVMFWIDADLYDRIDKVARHGDITDWATKGLEQGVAIREEELIEAARRKSLLQNLELTERAS